MQLFMGDLQEASELLQRTIQELEKKDQLSCLQVTVEISFQDPEISSSSLVQMSPLKPGTSLLLPAGTNWL